MTGKFSLFEPPPEVSLVADLLSEAVDALLVGEAERADQLLRRANIPSLWTYADRAMNPPKGMRLARVADVSAPVLSKRRRAAQRMPSPAEQRAIYRRDGYRCRYCGSRVVIKRARSILTAHLPEAVPWPAGPSGDKGKHAAFYALNSVIDHIVPHARGGDSSPDNLVTACWPCNFSEGDALLAEVGLVDPRDRPHVVDDWDGLERLLSAEKSLRKAALAGGHVPPVVVKRAPTEKRVRPAASSNLDEWLGAFEGRFGDLAPRLKDLLNSLEGPNVHLSIGAAVIVNLRVGARSLAVFGIDPNGNVDVPWLIGEHKVRFRPFAIDLAQVIPGARLYETRTMWRVDGGGARRGQITVEELLAASDVVREATATLIRNSQLDRSAM